MADDPSLSIASTPNFINPAYATPEQRKQLYAYANELMKPTPVANWAQGLGSIARALVGGYSAHQADLQEQNARWDQVKQSPFGAIASPSGQGSPPAPVAFSGAPPAAGNGDASLDPSVVTPYLQQAAQSRGIDPAVATKILMGESSGGRAYIGDKGSSFGPLQLHYGGVAAEYPHAGLGDDFTKATGLDARDPSTWQKQVDFALDKAKTQGWQPWTTTRDKLGLGNFDGIGQARGDTPTQVASLDPNVGAPSNDAMTVTVRPRSTTPVAAAQNAPQGGPPPPPAMARPVQMAQNATGNGLPVSGAQLNAYMTNPDVPPEMKRMALELVGPRPMTDVNNNVSISRQFQPPGAPIFAGGRASSVEANAPSIPSIITGAPNAPQNTMAPPAMPGQTPQQALPQGQPALPPRAFPNSTPGPMGTLPPASPAPGAPMSVRGAPSIASVFAPGSPVGDLIQQQQQNRAAGEATSRTASIAGDQLGHDRATAANFQRTINPLVQAIPKLEALGKTGTGPGTEERNNILSFLQSVGVPGMDSDRIKSFDEAKKYLTDFVNQNGNSGTNDKLAASFAGSPSVGISNAAAVDVAKSALALQRLQQAKVLAFGQAGMPEAAYGKYASEFASTQDPRAYGIDMMSPAARKALSDSMPPGSPERAKFNASLKTALDSGVVAR